MLSLFDPRGLYGAGMKLRERLLHDSDAVIRVGHMFLVNLEIILVGNDLMNEHPM